MTRRRLLRELDSEELSLWLAYDQVDVLPDLYWIGARICQTMVAAFAGKKTSIYDHMPRRKESRILPAEEAYQVLSHFAAIHNARLENGNNRLD
jgi:hypothetical protein